MTSKANNNQQLQRAIDAMPEWQRRKLAAVLWAIAALPPQKPEPATVRPKIRRKCHA